MTAGDSQAGRPLFIVLTGDGKGKSTSAFGTMLRAWARGDSIGVFQFMKSGSWEVGERAAARALGGIHWEVLGDGFSWASHDPERSTSLARAGWEGVRRVLAAEAFRFLVLDELTHPISLGWLDGEEVARAIQARPGFQHVVVTGRDAPPPLVEAADLVSEVRAVRHPLEVGVRAQRGIEW